MHLNDMCILTIRSAEDIKHLIQRYNENVHSTGIKANEIIIHATNTNLTDKKDKSGYFSIGVENGEMFIILNISKRDRSEVYSYKENILKVPNEYIANEVCGQILDNLRVIKERGDSVITSIMKSEFGEGFGVHIICSETKDDHTVFMY